MTKKLSTISLIFILPCLIVIGFNIFESRQSVSLQDTKIDNKKEMTLGTEGPVVANKKQHIDSSTQSFDIAKESDIKGVESVLLDIEPEALFEEQIIENNEILVNSRPDIVDDENILAEDIVVPPVKLEVVNDEERELLEQLERDAQEDINDLIADRINSQVQNLSEEDIIAEFESEFQLTVPLVKVEDVTQTSDFIPALLESE